MSDAMKQCWVVSLTIWRACVIGNRIGPDGSVAIAETLKTSTMITNVDLSGEGSHRRCSPSVTACSDRPVLILVHFTGISTHGRGRKQHLCHGCYGDSAGVESKHEYHDGEAVMYVVMFC